MIDCPPSSAALTAGGMTGGAIGWLGAHRRQRGRREVRRAGLSPPYRRVAGRPPRRLAAGRSCQAGLPADRRTVAPPNGDVCQPRFFTVGAVAPIGLGHQEDGNVGVDAVAIG